MKRNFFYSIKLAILILTISNVRAQDLHYTQFYNAHVNINPGLTGIFNGDVRMAANYRNQWRVLPVPYMTVTGAYDMKIYRKQARKDFFGAGLVFNYDQAGDSKLNLATLGLNGSYSLPVGVNNFFTVGAQLGFSRRAFSLDDLNFDEQWDGVQFIPTRNVTESFDRKSLFIPDLNMGVNYRIQKSTRSKADIGLAAFHINSPKNPFYTDDKSVKLPIRFAINTLIQSQLSNSLDLMVHGIAQFQKPYKEFLIGAGPKFYLNQKRGKNYALGVYGMYRFKDAIAPAFHLYLNELQLGISYDVNTSQFNRVTDKKGGPEFSLTYIITKVKPLSQMKACPIY
ncbi:MAG: PorP/SprF family type IX secretion system membrane protein [Saprospiraceae bacterium]|jgi:type IX secretion system PorP/SprF family membrane protein|nr:PorP/SprF family type IX secretion system membrane protein [Saprospiraceae bacterium]MBK6477658.1 PorP/SprF family type IX secretion system membrane protein [Saprospiraceae bacterium]MBK6816470.1 PorP/SprF family type IX secretion system membrane protein [Saprospiraceae bacterium]MBK7370994.1 PorP/SprF family type IX secretion system membrane protein [Saprospiraceae bacterium]MBK7436505.1 PorP/SprF family type IX secretion system membrane protein [Saprospiraceae bacterium]